MYGLKTTTGTRNSWTLTSAPSATTWCCSSSRATSTRHRKASQPPLVLRFFAAKRAPDQTVVSATATIKPDCDAMEKRMQSQIDAVMDRIALDGSSIDDHDKRLAELANHIQ
ncbi:unnamed protein product [Prorocentrum cordatum]|uniref:Uncharacterized protein n=1 Tax=Prorocentrum cordatum TaxID=2364126 RepID=A0ABN9VI15_9DINO|nr:unnamed protein product [Polarella glacialis]